MPLVELRISEMTSFGTKLVYVVCLSVILSTFVLAQTAAPVPTVAQSGLPTSTASSGDRFVRLAGTVLPSATSRLTVGQSSQLLASYERLPLAFEANEGQTNSEVKFLARSRGYIVFLTATDAVMNLHPGAKQAGAGPAFLRMRLAGANAHSSLSGSDELSGKTNYFLGRDPAKWHTDVPTYSKVHYSSIYPGVDLLYYGTEGRLEYDFVVSRGADPGAIRLEFEGAVPVIDKQGDLVLKLGQDEVRFRKPVVYQEANGHSGSRRFVDGRYSLTADHQAAFQLGSYDKNRPLIIDPILVYSTFLGGSSSDGAYGIFVDAAGNAYVTGGAVSNDFPTTVGAFQTAFGGQNGNCTEAPFFQCGDVFVTKLNPTATAPLVWSTYIGGTSSEVGFGIRADASGVYVAGQTSSTDFPTTGGAFQTALPNGSTRGGFITKLNPSGSALIYSTYLAGSTTDKLRGLAVDSGGNAYLTGGTQSADFPTTPSAFQTALAGASNAFVTKLNATGSALAYSTFLGGNTSDAANSITIDSSGDAYVTGGTTSTTFPTKNPIQAAFAGGGTTCPAQHVSICGDAFVTELDSKGSTLIFSTYLGGKGEDSGVGIALDPAGNIYVSGGTDSTDFPTTAGVVQPTFGGGSVGCTTAGEACGDAFLTKINAAKTAPFVYSTYLGGTDDDVAGFGLVIDAAGNVHMAGITGSNDFPVTANAIQPAFGGGTLIPNCNPGFVCGDAFVAKFSLDASTLAYSTYLGGGSDDGAGSIVQDTAGNDYVVGVTISDDFPVTPGVVQPTCGTAPFCNDGVGSDAFITKLAVPFPTASLLPLNVDFGNQVVGIPSQSKPVTLTNSGTDNLLITSILDANGFSQTNNCPIAPAATLGPTLSCTINITFTPTGPGTANDTLIITDDAAGSPQNIPLTGVGQPAGPIAKLAPTSLNFNTPQLLGTTSTAQPLTLSNVGTAALTITSIGFTGANASEFGQTNNCGSSLAVNASCTINVTFTPTTSGTPAASLTITDNSVGAAQAAALTGAVQGFSLTTTCTSLTVVPGQSAIYTVDLAPFKGFTQSVALGCSGAPALANLHGESECDDAGRRNHGSG